MVRAFLTVSSPLISTNSIANALTNANAAKWWRNAKMADMLFADWGLTNQGNRLRADGL
jgi:hypothetical protein